MPSTNAAGASAAPPGARAARRPGVADRPRATTRTGCAGAATRTGWPGGRAPRAGCAGAAARSCGQKRRATDARARRPAPRHVTATAAPLPLQRCRDAWAAYCREHDYRRRDRERRLGGPHEPRAPAGRPARAARQTGATDRPGGPTRTTACYPCRMAANDFRPWHAAQRYEQHRATGRPGHKAHQDRDQHARLGVVGGPPRPRRATRAWPCPLCQGAREPRPTAASEARCPRALATEAGGEQEQQS
jgi:hypothetical protein